jgi:hypothetical protein
MSVRTIERDLGHVNLTPSVIEATVVHQAHQLAPRVGVESQSLERQGVRTCSPR